MHRRRLRLWLTLSLALPLVACAGEEGLGGSPLATKQPDAASESPDPASPSPAPSQKPLAMDALRVTPSHVTLTSDPEAPPSARTAAFLAMATASGSQQVTSALWTANPSGRLTISQSGVVSVLPAALPGPVEVAASSGSFRATASVTIAAAPPSVQGLALSSAELGLYAPSADQANTAGYPTTAQLTATVLLSDGTTEGAVTWSALPEDVATVDPTGRVTALKKGTAIITARSVKTPAVAAQCTLTVQAKSRVEVSIQ